MKRRSDIRANWRAEVLTVDPGFGGTGWAFWIGNEYPLTGVIKEPRNVKRLAPEERLCLMYSQFQTLLKTYEPLLVVCETMELWSGSATSQASAGSGDLFFLQTLVGGYSAIAYVERAEFKLVTPNKWKGQLSKDALAARVQLVNGNTYPDHITDAVGIGIWLAGSM